MNQDAMNTINDCYVDFFDHQLNEKQIKFIRIQLPKDVIHLANQWGWNDTEVGDKVWRWISQNKEKIQ